MYKDYFLIRLELYSKLARRHFGCVHGNHLKLISVEFYDMMLFGQD